MTASSATHGGTVCPACSVRNPSGATSCRGCQRYLATIPAPRPIVKTTPPVPTKAPVTTNVPAARPEDGTTRYLCAAAQRYQWFSDPVIAEFGAADLERARARLEQLIARMRGGDFEVTAEPYEALCFGCPAAARLCPRPAWRPRR